MLRQYYDFLFTYAPIVACFLSLLILVLFAANILSKKSSVNISGVLIILATAMSVEFYLVQIYVFPFSLILPIGIVGIVLQRIRRFSTSPLFELLIIAFSMYLVFGLVALSSGASTWGDGMAPFGIFIVPNALIVLSYLVWREDAPGLVGISKIIVGVAGIIAVCITTEGFHYGEYDGGDVAWRRKTAVIICGVSLLEGIAFLRLKGKWFVKKELEEGDQPRV